MRRTMLGLVTALLVTASPAFAGGGEKGDFEIGVYGGYMWVDDYAYFHPKDDLLYGLRLGYWFSPNWSFEVSGQKLSTELDTSATTAVELDGIRLNGLYNFSPGSKFRPFLTAGAGREGTDIDGFSESSDIGWNAGAGFRVFFTPAVNLRADGRFVSVSVGNPVDETQGNVEATVGLNFLFGGGGSEPAAAAPVNQAPTVTCASERAEILPGETVRITATASDPEGDPLTYAWSSSVGRVTGTGATATLDFTGTTPPSNATVTVRVSDSRANMATCDVAVRLLEPVRPPESVSCLAGGFPRNLSRLTNVDKACLDDVVQRLKADPRARVVVIGHADSRETSPDAVGTQRADAVKAYLAEAGIEGARITTRSAGATRPVGTDAAAQAGNRRVEVWFVPEGGRVPE